ncbi:thioesterase II family protein [Streptomyces sp. NPDC087866]|uniref:thioesterase II family protein n=1 Tax=unclassified Streptomyces TaxID=2593676 RepID=UPI00224DC637|nr:alpha/beta fold hydrolase [Streptomyces sp. NBC_01789]MCX4446060.1 alpha/beta fold hydrolase [Streptomyces sp. NBC_01789]
MTHSLVCLPFAGGGAGFYRAWKNLPVHAPDIVPLQLPGREELFVEEPFRDAAEAADALAPAVAALTGGGPVALFGHSLGAVLAHEVARRLEQDPAVELTHLFVSGSPGPRTGRSRRATGLDDDAFLARVQEFAGYRHDALADPDMRELLLPVLRADVEMHENYRPATDEPLRTPVTSLRGTDDRLVSRDEAAEWQHATTGAFRLVELAGEHMYLTESPLPLLEAIGDALRLQPEPQP